MARLGADGGDWTIGDGDKNEDDIESLVFEGDGY